MPVSSAVINRLRTIPNFTIRLDAPLSAETRFGIGGAAAVLCDAFEADGLLQALDCLRVSAVPYILIGGGTNLVVADDGFDGVVFRFSAVAIHHEGEVLEVKAGAVLQEVVDRSICLGLEGLQTMTGIPGQVGGAVY